MINIPRLYLPWIADELAKNRQMAFLSGPRQVGKTTLAIGLADCTLRWEDPKHQALILKGYTAIRELPELKIARESKPVLLFDELHKFAKWKSWLKGFYDTYEHELSILVTGSARLDIYRKGGDSMMGRYFLYHVHPLSCGELLHPTPQKDLFYPPAELAEEDWQALWRHGGFPEPWKKRDDSVNLRWRTLRGKQLLSEDLRDLAKIQEYSLAEGLYALLQERSGQQLSLSSLAQPLSLSVDTVRRWMTLFSDMHVGFLLRPWHQRLTRSLRKEPKWYLRDWSGIEDEGQRFETMTACHLLKAVDAWTDQGLGIYELHYVRDTAGHEVDFLITENKKPWLLVEAKLSDTHLSPHLKYYQARLKPQHTLQVVMNLPYSPGNCFKGSGESFIVSAKTLFSQLP